MASKRSAGAALLVVCLSLCAACSNVETPDFKGDVEREMIVPTAWRPIPLRVGLAPMQLALEEKEDRNKEGTQLWVLKPDDTLLKKLHADMVEVMDTYKMFDYVGPIKEATPANTREEVQEMALRQGFDVVMLPTVRRRDVGYVDSNGSYGWNMFVWWMVSPILSWFIADEDFDCRLHIDLRLYPVTRDTELGGVSLKPKEIIQRSLDDFDQGFELFAIFGTPGSLDQGNWEKIGGKLMPIAEAEAKKALLRFITKDLFQRAERDEFKQAVRRRVGLVIGVDGVGVPPRYANADAEAMYSQLLEAENGRAAAAALRTLTGQRATRRAVETAAAELAPLARPNDDLVISFSGSGTLDSELRPALVLAQGAGGKPDVISLEEVIDLLAVSKPRTITLILDCAFTAPGDRRCATVQAQVDKLMQTHKGVSLFEPLQDKLKGANIPCFILSASDAVPNGPQGMKALEVDELLHGLFSAFALDAMSGLADTNGDQLVSFAEFRDYVSKKVAHVAELEGENQAGYFYASQELKDYFLPSGRRAPAKDRDR